MNIFVCFLYLYAYMCVFFTFFTSSPQLKLNLKYILFTFPCGTDLGFRNLDLSTTTFKVLASFLVLCGYDYYSPLFPSLTKSWSTFLGNFGICHLLLQFNSCHYLNALPSLFEIPPLLYPRPLFILNEFTLNSV